MQKPIAYQPGNSTLHRLHPLVKAAWLLVMTVLVFVVRQLPAILTVLVLCIIGLIHAGLSLKGRRGTKLLVLTGLALGVFQILGHQNGLILARLGPIAVTDVGLRDAVYIAGRFINVVLLSYLFVLSTDPNDLAYALMRAGLPYRYGFAMITALRLVPIFEQEAETVYYAQIARGIGHDSRHPRRLLDYARRLVLPMLSSALSKVDTLAISMEGRGFGRLPNRTFLRTVSFTSHDAIALILLTATLIGGIAIAL